MAFVIASATVQVSANTQPLHRALAEARAALARFAASNAAQMRTTRHGLGLLSQFVNPPPGESGKAPGVGRAVSRAATGITAALGGGALSAARGVSAALYQAVGAASDLNESINKTGVAFGSEGKAILDVANEMADRFGVVKQEVLDAAGGFGFMLRGAGMTAKEAAATSASLVRAAADVKSLQNMPVTAVLAKLHAGLSGEMEPLRGLGVDLSEAAVHAEAVGTGIAKAGKEMTQAQKTRARASLMLRGLTYAKGDRANTAGSAANLKEEIGGRIQNTMTKVGQAILPAWTSVLSRINTGLKNLGGWFDRNKAIVRDWAMRASTALSVLAGWGQKLAANVLPGIGRAIEYVDDAFTNWDLIAELIGVDIAEALTHVGERIQWLGGVAAAFLDWFGDNWQTLLMDTFNNTLTMFENLGSNVQELMRAIYASFRGEGWNFKATAITKGLRTNATELELPELKLSDFSAQRAEIKEKMGARINERDEARRKSREEMDKEEQAALGKEGAFGKEEEPKKRETRDMFSDPAAFAKNLQQHLFGQDVQRQQLSHLQKIANNTQNMASNAKKRGCNAHATLTAPD
jgi:hypothetical protein